ncbi:hypothetical protein D3C77_473510 [compost metagenome]
MSKSKPLRLSKLLLISLPLLLSRVRPVSSRRWALESSPPWLFRSRKCWRVRAPAVVIRPPRLSRSPVAAPKSIAMALPSNAPLRLSIAVLLSVSVSVALIRPSFWLRNRPLMFSSRSLRLVSMPPLLSSMAA